MRTCDVTISVSGGVAEHVVCSTGGDGESRGQGDESSRRGEMTIDGRSTPTKPAEAGGGLNAQGPSRPRDPGGCMRFRGVALVDVSSGSVKGTTGNDFTCDELEGVAPPVEATLRYPLYVL